MNKLYANRDIMKLDELGKYYCNHVSAMTREKLHDKSDIAAELGYRDYLIDQLHHALDDACALLADVSPTSLHLVQLKAELLRTAMQNMQGSSEGHEKKEH